MSNWRKAQEFDLIPFGTHRFPSGPQNVRVYFPIWRRVRESNPINLSVVLISSQVHYRPAHSPWYSYSDSNRDARRQQFLKLPCLSFHHRSKTWCGWRDFNSHARRHQFLRLACIAIPPHPRGARRGTQTPTQRGQVSQTCVSVNSTIRAKLGVPSRTSTG